MKIWYKFFEIATKFKISKQKEKYANVSKTTKNWIINYSYNK